LSGRLSAIVALRLTTALPQRLVQFYESIGFSAGPPVAMTPEDMALLELEGRGTRIALRVGSQRIELESFDQKGRRYPENVTAADLCFQHFALVTRDAAAAWERARAHGATPISTEGAVTLPVSAGGVTAAKLRDPEGHPLEFLQFPSAAGSREHRECVLGIDHSAISVADAGVSQRFYEALGLRAGRPTLNDGPTQAALDGSPDVRVDVVPMSPEISTPHLELLGYRNPIGRPASRWSANDVAATRIVWRSDRNALLRDPDGHLHLLTR
jgi:catechol 2,3-dioxygenase-like lactoylglutathione lyase family enzyme